MLGRFHLIGQTGIVSGIVWMMLALGGDHPAGAQIGHNSDQEQPSALMRECYDVAQEWIFVESIGVRNADDTEVIEFGVTRDDYRRVLNTLPNIETMVPWRSMATKADAGGDLDPRPVAAVGATPEWHQVVGPTIESGRFLSEVDLRQASRVCVITTDLAERLFPLINPIGEALTLDDNPFLIIGVATLGFDEDTLDKIAETDVRQGHFSNETVFIPLTTMRTSFGDFSRPVDGVRPNCSYELSGFAMRVDYGTNRDETIEVLRELLDRFHSDSDYVIDRD